MAIYLNEFGVICALGTNKQEVADNLSNGVEPLTLDNMLHVQKKPVYVGRVQGALPTLAEYPATFRTRNNALAQAALAQLMPKLNEFKATIDAERIAVVIGTSTSSVLEGEHAKAYYLEHNCYPDDFDYSCQELYGPAEFIAHAIGAKGPSYSISTACSSSSKALISAKMLLESDIADLVICGGVDSLCSLTISGFDALESISARLCEPFGAERDGINIGEAAALFIVTKQLSQVRLAGIGESSDAYHISAPEPTGSGAIVSMKQALKQAGITEQQIGYINLHGTGTPKNDEMESRAVNAVFACSPPVSSTKRYTGHTLGAAGALEAGICWLLLNNDSMPLPINKNNQAIDPALASINLVKTSQLLKSKYCLSNSFAFGGNNASILLAGESINE